MSEHYRQIYEFGPFRLDPRERSLLRDGSAIPLTAKAFDVLYILVQKNNRLVEKSELISSVWGDCFVEEGNLTVMIHTLRKTLGDDDAADRRFIQTVAKRGYRFVAPVHELGEVNPVNPMTSDVLPIVSSGNHFSRRAIVRFALLGILALAVMIVLFEIIHPRNKNVSANGLQAIHSLAVIPFSALSVPGGQEYLTLGITDAVITRLASTGQFAVRPTSSTAKYAKTSDPVAAGREQQVDAILEGNIEAADQQVRVSVQLVRVRDGFVLWANSFQERTEQIFVLEEEIAQGVLQSAALRLSEQDKAQLERFGTSNVKAYELYLQARYFWNLRTKNDVHRSIECFQKAIAIEPHYALAYAGLANAYVILNTFGEPPWEIYPNAKAAAMKAVELDSSLADAHAALGMVALHYEWNWAQAQKEFERSISLNPNDSIVRVWYATELAAMGRREEAMSQAEHAQELDPVSPIVNMGASRILYWSREYDRAIAGFEKVSALEPKFAPVHTRCGVAYLAKRNINEATREFKVAREISGPDPYLDGLIGYTQAISGNAAAAHKVLDQLIARSGDEYTPAFSVALVYMGLGDKDRAIEWLQKSYQDRSTYMIYARTDALFDPVRSDPRFQTLLQRMGLS